MNEKIDAAIIGSGNIGTDLMMKMLLRDSPLRPAILVGIDPASDGLARAGRHGVATTAAGVEGLLEHPAARDIRVVFDATSAAAHHHNAAMLADHPAQIVDLTPAAIGPFTVPVVNGDSNAAERNVNMVTCGGQATIPIVHAISRVTPVGWAEIVASISSRSAGPGTRANIDEFTQTTAKGLEVIGGAEIGKAIIVLNPADPPLVMRDTVLCLAASADESALRASIHDIVAKVSTYVPGYRLKWDVLIEKVSSDRPLPPGVDPAHAEMQVSVLLEVEGAGDYLPPWAGNLDIMTAAAHATALGLVNVRTAVGG